MQFCPKCKTLMKLKDGKALCIKCGHSDEHEKIKTSEKVEKKEIAEGIRDDKEMLPKTNMECPKCRHYEAYFWSKQTRSSDEGETQFFRCVKCKHTWRKYR